MTGSNSQHIYLDILYFPTHNATEVKNKENLQPIAQDRANLTRLTFGQKEEWAANIWFKQLEVLWLNEALDFASIRY